MSQNVMDTLRARGFIKQTVYEDELYEKLGSESVPFYIGFDPTADSLHVGHFMQLIAMRHMQDAGHKPIILIGGGTGMIGDPSGRTDMRSMMTRETVKYHVECFKKQMSRFIRFEGENGAIIVDNADWLLDLNYIDFLREIGANFSVNKMLTAECYRSRMEKGLTFLEFNYMLMQAYDFLVLALPQVRLPARAGRRRPVEQHSGGRRPHPPQGAETRLCDDLYPAHDERGQEDGQDAEGRCLAG